MPLIAPFLYRWQDFESAGHTYRQCTLQRPIGANAEAHRVARFGLDQAYKELLGMEYGLGWFAKHIIMFYGTASLPPFSNMELYEFVSTQQICNSSEQFKKNIYHYIAKTLRPAGDPP
jgi:hypothetical protein